MGFTSDGPRIWPMPPDWANPVNETLAWGTNVTRASATGVSEHLGYETAPARSFAFDVNSAGDDRRLLDMLLAGPRGRWLLPIWPDVQWFTAPLASGAVEIPCATIGFDFVEGGQALLYRASNAWEIVTVDEIADDHIGLVAATLADYGPGARLYPLRQARLQEDPEERFISTDLSRRRLAFDIDEACAWPALADPTLYLGRPVLDVRPDESEDPTASYARLRQSIDFEGALPFVYDLADVALRAQQTRWLLSGRPAHSWFRSLLYTLQGQLAPLWLPSFQDDLRPAYTIAGGSATLSVAWAGYTQNSLGRSNRRDLRFELGDGSVLYRRVTDAEETGETEALTLSSALDAGAIAPGQIRQVSIMAMAVQAGDSAEIEHVTDAAGLARATLGWQAVVPDA